MALGTRDHTVCRVSFEDRDGHRHNVTLRIPRKVPVTHRNVVTMASFVATAKKERPIHVARLVGETCTTARRSKSHRLPR